MPSDTQQRLAEHAARGESSAVAAVYEQLAPAVRGYFLSHGAREPDDLTNEVFLQLIPRLRGIRGGWEGLRTLTFRIAHARLVDEYRKSERAPRQVSLVDEDDPRTWASAETIALEQLSDGGAAAALYLLPEDQRCVIVLRVLADLSVHQVAEVLGLTTRAVSALQSRAILSLRLLVSRNADDVVGA